MSMDLLGSHGDERFSLSGWSIVFGTRHRIWLESRGDCCS
jgi:hypothetical protein